MFRVIKNQVFLNMINLLRNNWFLITLNMDYFISSGLITRPENIETQSFTRYFNLLPWGNCDRSRTFPNKFWWKNFNNFWRQPPSKFPQKRRCSWWIGGAMTKNFFVILSDTWVKQLVKISKRYVMRFLIYYWVSENF